MVELAWQGMAGRPQGWEGATGHHQGLQDEMGCP